MSPEPEVFTLYWSLVEEYGKAMNLTAWNTYERWWELGIKPSLKFAEVIPHGASVIDIGSGQGLPGLVIALMCPESHVTLVEPRLKRAAFLRLAVRRLQLSTEVVTSRAQDCQGRYDIITSRAVAPPETIYQWTKHLSHLDTQWILRKPINNCEYIVNNHINYVSYE